MNLESALNNVGVNFNSCIHILELADIAQQEIEKVYNQTQDKEARARVWSSFMLLFPTSGITFSEELFRKHCKELIIRARDNKDLTKPTNIEVIYTLAKTSLMAPLNNVACGLYLKYGNEAGIDPGFDVAEWSDHYEAIDSHKMNRLEQEITEKLTQPDRKLTNIRDKV